MRWKWFSPPGAISSTPESQNLEEELFLGVIGWEGLEVGDEIISSWM
jgi:hypothetical protein